MNRRSMLCVFRWSGMAVLSVAIALLARSAAPAEKAAAPKAGATASETPADKPAAEKPAAKKGKKAASRLPMYYAQVVDEKQRGKILAIIDEYAPKIDALKAQMDAMTKDRDAKVQGVLTPAQMKKLEDIKAAANKKRQSTKDVKKQPPASEQSPAQEPAPVKRTKKAAKPAKPADGQEPAK